MREVTPLSQGGGLRRFAPKPLDFANIKINICVLPPLSQGGGLRKYPGQVTKFGFQSSQTLNLKCAKSCFGCLWRGRFRKRLSSDLRIDPRANSRFHPKIKKIGPQTNVFDGLYTGERKVCDLTRARSLLKPFTRDLRVDF